MNTGLSPMYEWRNINWRKVERWVFKLQKRIYQASQSGDKLKVRQLQRLLIKSWYAKLLAVRRVTQENRGKKTAGVDRVKSLNPKQRLNLTGHLILTGKSKPTRRIWINKPGTDEKRPLGIPTMFDRALQALVKLALEPEWEARFEPNSYGFRPCRGVHDAIESIFTSIKQKPKWVLDADIAKCFDRIQHNTLLAKLDTFPHLRRQIKAWLKSGVVDEGELFPTVQGTPQGAVLSPLLANIALHGLEELMEDLARQYNIRYRSCSKYNIPKLIRYADDLVVLHEDKWVIELVQTWLENALLPMGLQLKPTKTKIVHTLEGTTKPGFDFLGFHVRQYPVGKYHTGTICGNPLGFKTIIKPSKDKQKAHLRQIKAVINTHQAAPQKALIGKLNPIIRGWANYYRTVCSCKTFAILDHLTFIKLRKWAKKRHPYKSWGWVKRRYWKTMGNDHWAFTDATGTHLLKRRTIPIQRHTKVKGTKSPLDGDMMYWARRLQTHPELSSRELTLLKIQNGKCTYCGLNFKHGDWWEIDHRTPRSCGGKDTMHNLQLLHGHCHDRKTTHDGSYGTCKSYVTE